MTKQLQVKQGPYGFFVHYEGGGQMPKELGGYYTSKARAQAAIAAYIPKKRVRKSKDADSEE
jgi:hypothetical protein